MQLGMGSVRLPLDDIYRMIRRNQCVSCHATPRGQIRRSPGILRDNLQAIPGVHQGHTAMEFEDELTTTHLSGVPMLLQERPLEAIAPHAQVIPGDSGVAI